MGKLRFGVAFAVTGKEVEGVTPDPTASSGQALALSPRERGQKRGRDIRERGFPGGGRKRKRGTWRLQR